MINEEAHLKLAQALTEYFNSLKLKSGHYDFSLKLTHTKTDKEYLFYDFVLVNSNTSKIIPFRDVST